MEELLEQLLEECRPYTQQGEVASYIPELAKGNRNDLGIYVLRSDGRHYQAGDYQKCLPCSCARAGSCGVCPRRFCPTRIRAS